MIAWLFLRKKCRIITPDKERFAAASSCIETGILTLLFPRKRRRSSPSPFSATAVQEAIASRILKLIMTPQTQRLENIECIFLQKLV